MKNVIKIGTRSSKLALWQANYVKSSLESLYPGIEINLKLIKTKGDAVLDTALSKIGDQGLFTKEIELELLSGSIDLAVHSLKDLQVDIPEGLKLATVTERGPVEDVLVAKEKGIDIFSLNDNCKIGTSSLRRAAQLLHFKPQATIADVRGNVQTRIEKLFNSDLDAIILARAGVERLGLDKYISSIIPSEIFLPAVGQGALGIEIAAENHKIENLVKPINHLETCIAVTAERAFLRSLGGGCRAPVAALAKVISGEIIMEGLAASTDGKKYNRCTITSSADNPELCGSSLAERIIAQGADLIKDIK